MKQIIHEKFGSLAGIRPVADKSKDDLYIYPNPSTGHLTVSIPGGSFHNTLNIISLDGKVILTKEFSGSAISLDLVNLPKGMYLIEVRNKFHFSTGKVVRL
jgi:hypothetical protein